MNNTPIKFLSSFCNTCLVILFICFGTSSAHALVPISGCKVISAPGLYVLTTNITAKTTDLKSVGGSVPACILITADFVTLELGGLTISGPGASISAFGVYATNGNTLGTHGVLIRNGSVTGFSRGIAIEGYADAAENVSVIGDGTGLTFDRGFNSAKSVRAYANNGTGILCFGGGVSVRESEVTNNGNNGIELLNCTGNCVVGNSAWQNGGAGITVTCPSLILENVAFQNAGGDILSNPSASCTQANNNPAP